MAGRFWRAGWAGLLLLVAGALAATAQPPHLDEWTAAHTVHFTVLSNAEPLRAAEIAVSLERFQAAFSLLAPELELRSPTPTRIFAFADAEAYAPYKTVADQGSTKILGQFLSQRDGNFITLNADPSFLGSFSVIFHEYVHYFVQHNFPGVPLWFNEGLAEYYSTFAVEGDYAFVGRPVERHLRWLLRNRELDLAGVLEAKPRSGSRQEQKAGHFYAVSWALVHYLLSGGEATGDQLATFLALSAEGEEPVDAFERAFGRRPAAVEEDLRRYSQSSRFPVARLAVEDLPGFDAVVTEAARPAAVLTGLGDLLAQIGRDTEAEKHFDLARSYEPSDAEAWAGLAFLRHRQGRLAEAEELYRQALELGPRSALTHLRYGRHLTNLAQGGGWEGDGEGVARLAEDARNAYDRAARTDTGFAEARAMLGISHLFGTLDPADGIPHLEQARERLPGRSDLVFHLVQLYLRAERRREAEQLTETVLARMGEPEVLAGAREEIERWGLVEAANRALREGRNEEALAYFDEAVSVTSDPALRAQMEEKLLALQKRFEER